MSRKVFDCRDFPGPCELVLAGSEEEIMQAGVSHVVTAHERRTGPSSVRRCARDKSRQP